MPVYSISTLFNKKYTHEKLTREFSLNEFNTCYYYFKHAFKDQLSMPTADNNYLINYDL